MTLNYIMTPTNTSPQTASHTWFFNAHLITNKIQIRYIQEAS